MQWHGPVRAVRPDDAVQHLLDEEYRTALLRAGWVPCSPEWLAEHPGECGTAMRAIGRGDTSHWHPRETRRQILREAADKQRKWLADPANQAVIEARGAAAVPDVIDPGVRGA